MTVYNRYIICWADGTQEVYDTPDERSGRLLQLDDSDYERDVDFWIYTDTHAE